MVELKLNYSSPRWSAEVCDCAMPMTFDTYSGCSFNCLYCFAFFQKSHSVNGYLTREISAVNPEKVKNLFINSLSGNWDKLSAGDRQFAPYIKNKVTMQWGGMADGFDEYERRYGLSLELLRFFDKIKYPLSISTKGTWFTEDERYMELIRRNSNIWHFKISIITSDPMKARAIERGVDSPQKRFEAIKRLKNAGCHVTLRLRPFMVGISDDYATTIRNGALAGADSVTTEFFCLEARADKKLKAKYKEMSKYCGVDLWDLYAKESKMSGYRRLNYQFKEKIILDMQKIAHSYGMRFYVSDAHHKEKSDFCCCCGTPPEFKVSMGHFAQALQIAKSRENGLVYFSDIADDLKKYVGEVEFYKAAGFNTGSNQERAKWLGKSLYDYVKTYWNTPKQHKSPEGYFEGVLYSVGVDKEGNVIYKLNRDKAKL